MKSQKWRLLSQDVLFPRFGHNKSIFHKNSEESCLVPIINFCYQIHFQKTLLNRLREKFKNVNFWTQNAPFTRFQAQYPLLLFAYKSLISWGKKIKKINGLILMRKQCYKWTVRQGTDGPEFIGSSGRVRGPKKH